jgi:bifunctional DNA-binding transcriptional regulator/antitoxin component of YhaV-PrlF toxin-antitoxin module
MKTALLSSKNQITIPKSLQQQAGIPYRSRVSLRAEKGTIVIELVSASIVNEIAGSLAEHIPPKLKGVSASRALSSAAQEIAESLEKQA